MGKAATASDDSERAKKVFQCKAEEADATYDDASKKLAQCEADLDKAEERADVGETKIRHQGHRRLLVQRFQAGRLRSAQEDRHGDGRVEIEAKAPDASICTYCLQGVTRKGVSSW